MSYKDAETGEPVSHWRCVCHEYNEPDATDCDKCGRAAPQQCYLPGTCWVNVYLVDRAYGGPEEGGWWYDTGTAVRSTQVRRNSPEPIQHRNRMVRGGERAAAQRHRLGTEPGQVYRSAREQPRPRLPGDAAALRIVLDYIFGHQPERVMASGFWPA